MPRSLTTDGFDLEASYQFDLQDYDVPGNFVLRSLVNHTSKYISDTRHPGHPAECRTGRYAGRRRQQPDLQPVRR